MQHPTPKSHDSLLLFLTLLLLTSCGKDKIELTWEEQNSNINTVLTSVYFTDANTGHVMGGETWAKGYYLSTIDGGANWEVDSLANKRLNGLIFKPSGKGYAVGVDGYFFKKESPLEDWFFYRLPRWEILTDVCFNNADEGMVVGGAAFKSGVAMRIEGTAVTQIDTFKNELAAACYSDDNTVHAVGYGIVLRSDSGGPWERKDIEGDFFRAIHFPSQEVGYVVGSAGTIMKTTDGGLKWDKIRDGSKIRVSNKPFRDVFFVNEDRGYIVGEGGLFWITENGGDDWKVVKNFSGDDLLSVHVVDGHGHVVSEQGGIFHFEE